jgi:hypothetical protein
MKNRSSKLRLPDFFRQRLPGKVASGHMPKLGKSESEGLEAESLMEDILRWADDGGQMLDLGNSQYPSNSDTAGKRANPG